MAAAPTRIVKIIAGCGLAGAGIAAVIGMSSGWFGHDANSTSDFETSAGQPTAADGAKDAPFPACRHPMHGVEQWREQERSQVDSGWKVDPVPAAEFCAREQMKLQTDFPNRTIELLDIEHSQRQEGEYNVAQDRTICHFRNSWHPIYKLDRSKYCKY